MIIANYTPSILERDFARIINYGCYYHHNTRISDIITNIISEKTYKEPLTTNLLLLLLTYSNNNHVLRLSNLLGIYDYFHLNHIFYKETVTKAGGLYTWTFQLTNNGLNSYLNSDLNSCLINKQIYNYILHVIDIIIKFKNIKGKLSTTYNSITLIINPTPIIKINTPLIWLHRYNIDAISIYKKRLLPIGYFRKTKPICIYANELLSDININPNLSISEIFKHYGYYDISKIEAETIWNKWQYYLIWLRKYYFIVPLTLMNRNRATIKKQYDDWDEIYYYTELAEVLLSISVLPFNLQQIIGCYL